MNKIRAIECAFLIFLRDILHLLEGKAGIILALLFCLFLLLPTLLGQEGMFYALPLCIALFSYVISFSSPCNLEGEWKDFRHALLLSGGSPFRIWWGKLLLPLFVTLCYAFCLRLIFLHFPFPFSLPFFLFFSAFLSLNFVSLSLFALALNLSSFSFFIWGFFLFFFLFFFSNALFSLHSLPPIVKPIAYLNPLTYGLDGLKWALGSRGELNLLLDFCMLILFFVFLQILLFLSGGIPLDRQSGVHGIK